MNIRLLLLAFFFTQFLSAQSNYYVKFPADVAIQSCTDGFYGHAGKPEFFNPDSLPLRATYEDEIYTIIWPYFCLRVDRHWTVYDSLSYNSNKPCIYVPTPNPPSNFSPNVTDFPTPAVIISPSGTPAPWEPSIAKQHFQDTVLSNYSMFWSDTANCYKRTQYFYFLETQPPIIKDCPQSLVEYQDSTANNPLFWNASYWNDPSTGIHDLDESPLELSITAFDSCTGSNVGIDYWLYLDLDGDGVQETVIGQSTATPGSIRYNNVSGTGELREFDQRVVAPNKKYQFDLKTEIIGNTRKGTVVWKEPYPNTTNFVLPQLPRGIHKILWEVNDGTCGNTATCSYYFRINGPTPTGPFSGVAIHFPDDIKSDQCIPSSAFGAPEINNPYNQPISITYEDVPVDFSPNCLDLERTWRVTNSQTFDPLKALTNVPNPRPFALSSNPANLLGPTVSAAASPAPWAPTVVKVNSIDPNPTNYSSFWSIDANGYSYKQRITVNESTPPEISNCPTQPLTVTDSSSNDPLLWNDPLWLEHSTGGHDLSETPVLDSIIATDDCSGSNVYFNFLLKLDLDEDGTPETVVSSNNPPAPGTVRYNNINTLNYAGGEVRYFDQRPLPASDLYRFGATSTSNGLYRTGRLCWYSGSTPNVTISPVQLPPGAHEISWAAIDNCGNSAPCQYHFTVPFDSIVPTIEAGLPSGFGRLQNNPNPFTDKTVISFELKEAGDLLLRVFDATGRIVYERNTYLNAGKQRIPVDLPGESEMLYYSVQTGKNCAVQKMIRVK